MNNENLKPINVEALKTYALRLKNKNKTEDLIYRIFNPSNDNYIIIQKSS